MPQLIPYFFVNQLSFTFLVLLALVFVLSKYILPYNVSIYLTRYYITTLS